jgi:hypothetical protein
MRVSSGYSLILHPPPVRHPSVQIIDPEPREIGLWVVVVIGHFVLLIQATQHSRRCTASGEHLLELSARDEGHKQLGRFWTRGASETGRNVS